MQLDGFDRDDGNPSEMVVMHVERVARPGTVILPDDLMAAALERAVHLGIPLETFVQSAIERALNLD